MVNEFLQSVSNPAVYAAGDAAASGPPLTPVAGMEGGIVATNLLEGNHRQADYRAIPTVVFTIPALAAVGLQEASARKQGLNVRVNWQDTSGWYSSRRLGVERSGSKVIVEQDSNQSVVASCRRRRTMASSQPRLIKILNQLYRLNQDSARGFEAVAGHVKNPALKLLLKAYAGQRAHFAAELQERVVQQRSQLSSSGSLLAAFHRGWINIKAAMTLGRENVERVVLAEALRGEAVAAQCYHQALDGPLPTDLLPLLQGQAAAVEQARIHLRCLAGTAQRKLIVELFESAETAQQVVTALAGTGIAAARVHWTNVAQEVEAYQCQCHAHRVLETSAAGSLLGLILGLLLGLLAGFAPMLGATAEWMWETVVTTTGVGLLGGGVLGTLLGLLIGQATVEDDAYVYDQSLRSGQVLLSVETDERAIPALRHLLRTLHAQAPLRAFHAA